LQTISGNLRVPAIQERGNENVQKRVSAASAAEERSAKRLSQLLASARRQPLSPTVLKWSSEKSLFPPHKCVIKVEPPTMTIAVDGPTCGTISRSKTRKFRGARFTKYNWQSWEWV